MKCGKCLGSGHISIRCIYTNTCIYCTSTDHKSYKCKISICYRCKQLGHLAKDCKFELKEFCKACRIYGHIIENCIARDFPIKACRDTTCLSCRGKGHTNCKNHKNRKKIEKIKQKRLLASKIKNWFLRLNK